MKFHSIGAAVLGLILIWPLIATSSSTGDFDYYDGPSPYGDSTAALNIGYLKHAVPLNQELNFESLLNLIASKKIRSIEALIPALPDYMKNDNYVVMYRSRSLQEASPTAPRILLYTPTASLVMTYNGGIPGTEGATTLEVIQYRRPQHRFEFRELVFDGKHAPVVSGPNPSACIACHQSPSRKDVDLRPNWEPYSTWIGAFGANDGDVVFSSLAKDLGDRARPEDKEALDQQANEEALLANYQKKVAPTHPRYSPLGPVNLHAPVELTQHLAVWNFERVVRLMKEQTEIYPAYRELVWYAALCGYDDYLVQNPFMQWAEKQPMRRYFQFGAENEVSPVLTRIFEPYGVDTSDWSMDFGTRGRFAFEERFGTPGNPETVLEYALEHVDDSDHISKKSCDDLRKTIDSKLGQFFAKGENLRIQALHHTTPPSGKDVVARCLHCHSADSMEFDAPTLQFDDPSFVSKYLHAGNYKHGTLLDEVRYRTSDMALESEQMPPSVRLTAEERQALLTYLEKMAVKK